MRFRGVVVEKVEQEVVLLRVKGVGVTDSTKALDPK